MYVVNRSGISYWPALRSRRESPESLAASRSNLLYRTYMRDVNLRLKACNYEIMKGFVSAVSILFVSPTFTDPKFTKTRMEFRYFYSRLNSFRAKRWRKRLRKNRGDIWNHGRALRGNRRVRSNDRCGFRDARVTSGATSGTTSGATSSTTPGATSGTKGSFPGGNSRGCNSWP